MEFLGGCICQKQFNECIDTISEYKYIVTKDDVINVIRSTLNLGLNICIQEIEKYGIKCDTDIQRACFDMCKYFYKEVQNISVLHKSFEQKNKSLINFLLSVGVIPDIICLQYACQIPKNITMIKLLTKHVNPNIICIQNATRLMVLDGRMCDVEPNLLIDEYIKINNGQYEKYGMLCIKRCICGIIGRSTLYRELLYLIDKYIENEDLLTKTKETSNKKTNDENIKEKEIVKKEINKKRIDKKPIKKRVGGKIAIKKI